SRHNGGHWTAPKSHSVKRAIAAARGTLIHVVGPAAFWIEDGNVRNRAGAQRAAGGLSIRGCVQSHDARRVRRAQLDQTRERDSPSVNQPFERQCKSSLKTNDAERRQVELLHLVATGVRRVVGGDSVNGAISEAFQKRLAIFAAAQRRL